MTISFGFLATISANIAVEIIIERLSPLERRRHAVVKGSFRRFLLGGYRLEQFRIHLRSTNLLPIQHFVASFVSKGSVFRQVSLNNRQQRAAIFIDRKYVLLITGNHFRERDLRGKTYDEGKDDRASVLHALTLTIGTPTLKNILSRAIQKFRNSALFPRFRTAFFSSDGQASHFPKRPIMFGRD